MIVLPLALVGRPRFSGPPGSLGLREDWRSGAADFASPLNAPGFVAITLRPSSLGRLTLCGAD